VCEYSLEFGQRYLLLHPAYVRVFLPRASRTS
jgi:hypothetical protein